MVAITDSVQIKINETGAASAAKGIGAVGVAATSANTGVVGLAGGIRTLALRLGALALAVVSIQQVGKAIRFVGEQERVINLTRQALESTGNVVNKTLQGLSDVADEFQRTTTFANEEIQDLQQTLIRFTNITEETFDRSTEAILDFAAATGGNAVSAATMLGRALDDPVRNLSLLGRSGIQFSKEQTELIKTLVETGRAAEAQGIILDALAIKFGGSAVAAAQGLGGAFKQLSNETDDTVKELGNILFGADATSESMGGLERTVRSLTDGFRSLNQVLGAVPEIFRNNRRAAEDFVVGLKEIASGQIEAENSLGIFSSAFERVTGFFRGIGDELKSNVIVNAVTEFASTTKKEIDSAFNVKPITDFISEVSNIGLAIRQVETTSQLDELFNNLSEQIRGQELLINIGARAEDFNIEDILNVEQFDTFQDRFNDFFSPLKTGLESVTPEIQKASAEMGKFIEQLTIDPVRFGEQIAEQNIRFSESTQSANDAVLELTESLDFQTKAYGLSGTELVKLQLETTKFVAASQDVKDALIAQSEEFEKQKQLTDLAADIGRSFSNAFLELTTGSVSAAEAFKRFALSVISDILRMIAVAQLTKVFGSLFGFSSGGTVDGGSVVPSKKGNVFNNGNVIPSQRGGIISSPTLFPLSNRQTGLVGESGPEVIFPLTRTGSGDLGIKTTGGGGGNVISITVAPTVNVTGSLDSAENLNNDIIATVVPVIQNIVEDELTKQRRNGRLMASGF